MRLYYSRFRVFSLRLHVAHCDHSRDFSIRTAESHAYLPIRNHMHETPALQYCNHASDCIVCNVQSGLKLWTTVPLCTGSRQCPGSTATKTALCTCTYICTYLHIPVIMCHNGNRLQWSLCKRFHRLGLSLLLLLSLAFSYKHTKEAIVHLKKGQRTDIHMQVA